MTINSASPTVHLNSKILAAVLFLSFAGVAHSPKAEAGVPVFDVAALTQMLTDWTREKIRACFDVNSVKEAVTRVQDIQKMAQRARVTMNMTELMPERDEMEGIESCPNPSGGSLTASAASWASGALGLGNKRIDGSTDLRSLQQQLCASEIILQNRKWNAERSLLKELEGQAADYQEILGKWNSMADMKGQVEAICSVGESMSVTGGGANEGRQASLQQELAQRSADNNRALADQQAKIGVLDGAIASVRAKQAEVGQKMLNGESGGFLTGVAAGAIQAALLKGALDSAKSK